MTTRCHTHLRVLGNFFQLIPILMVCGIFCDPAVAPQTYIPYGCCCMENISSMERDAVAMEFSKNLNILRGETIIDGRSGSSVEFDSYILIYLYIFYCMNSPEELCNLIL